MMRLYIQVSIQETTVSNFGFLRSGQVKLEVVRPSPPFLFLLFDPSRSTWLTHLVLVFSGRSEGCHCRFRESFAQAGFKRCLSKRSPELTFLFPRRRSGRALLQGSVHRSIGYVETRSELGGKVFTSRAGGKFEPQSSEISASFADLRVFPPFQLPFAGCIKAEVRSIYINKKRVSSLRNPSSN